MSGEKALAAKSGVGPVQLNRRDFERRVLSYALAVGGTAAGLAGTPAAAEVIYTKANYQLDFGNLNLDLNHDGVRDFTVTIYSTGSWSSYLSKLRVSRGAGPDSAVVGLPRGKMGSGSALEPGTTIGPNTPPGFFGLHSAPALMATGFCTFALCRADGPWAHKTAKYLGLRFQWNGENHYGWARLTLTATPFQGFTVYLSGYAYETEADTALVTGDRGLGEQAVRAESPAGPTLGMLSLGSAARKPAR